MFNYTSEEAYVGTIETLYLLEDPKVVGIGRHFKDENGMLWDIKSIRGHGKDTYITAREVDDSYRYNTQDNFKPLWSSYTWIPYYYKVVKK